MFCPSCGKQSAPSANFCSSCGAVTSQPPTVVNRIVRPRHPRMIAGVCAGVAIHFGWDIPLVRILLCVFTILTSGLGLLVYIAAWVLLPEAPYALPAQTGFQPTYPSPTQNPGQGPTT